MQQPSLAIGLLALLACSTNGAATEFVATPAPSTPPQASVTAPAPLLAAGGALDRIPDVAERAVQSVVNISTEKTVAVRGRGMGPFGNDPMFRQFFGPGPQQAPQERVEQGRGSGVIVGADGLVVTNNHVVGGAEDIQVTLSDGRTFEANLVGTDSHSDLAVVRLVDPPPNLVPLPFGDSDDLRLGEVVLAIGNPFGIGQTVTMGIVSAKGRSDLGIVDYEDFIQTDAAINPGNSGGALVNLNGELVGINTAIISGSGGYQGVGFAIPSDMARRISDDLLEDGKVSRGFLGVRIQNLEPALRDAMGIDSGTGGVIIADVTPGSAAEAAGLKRGDIVVNFDGRPVEDVTSFRLGVASTQPGSKFKAEVVRDGKRRKLTGVLGELDDADGEAPQAAPPSANDALGLSLAPLGDDLRERLGVPSRVRGGVVVSEVEPGSPAEKANLQSGDVILEVNRRAVGDPQDVTRALESSGDKVLFLVLRRGATLFVVVTR